MKVTISTAGWNEIETIIPVIRYYLEICNFDKFIYYDNFSDDGTLEKVSSTFKNDSRVVIKHTPYIGHKPVEEVHLMNDTMHSDDSEVFIWIDSDEILYCRNFKSHLEELFNQKKTYVATYMTNVYNESDSFDESKYNIVDNFTLCVTDRENPVFKVPIIFKQEGTKSFFGGGHHSITTDGISYGDFNQNPLDKTQFADNAVHLFHFTYINKDIYYQRKTIGRERNIKLGIDNSWYHDYWNLSTETISNVIKQQKEHSISIKNYK
jgi:hypothetical protein